MSRFFKPSKMLSNGILKQKFCGNERDFVVAITMPQFLLLYLAKVIPSLNSVCGTNVTPLKCDAEAENQLSDRLLSSMHEAIGPTSKCCWSNDFV